MENNKINVEQTIKAIIEQEGKENGIQLIRKIVNSIAKNKRKQNIRVNTYDSIAYKVYELMYDSNYSRIRAMEKIETEKGISLSTINNHLRTFNKLAKEDNYLDFGKAVDEIASQFIRSDTEFKISKAIEYGEDINFTEYTSVAFYYKLIWLHLFILRTLKDSKIKYQYE